MPVIGFIAEVPLVEPLLAAFRRAMAELGYVEGKNFAAEYRLKPESLPQAAADLQTPMVRCWRCRNVLVGFGLSEQFYTEQREAACLKWSSKTDRTL
jgi:hypothetical protein